MQIEPDRGSSRSEGRRITSVSGTEWESIRGDYVIAKLPAKASVLCERGARISTSGNVRAQAQVGNEQYDPLDPIGNVFKFVRSAFEAQITGEHLLFDKYSNTGAEKAQITFSAKYPGDILLTDLRDHGGAIFCQRGAYLCGDSSTRIRLEVVKNLLFGALSKEGFILQRLEGSGVVCANTGGTLIEHHLRGGESLRLDTGTLVGFSKGIKPTIRTVGSGTALFGGEGLVDVELSGEGTVWASSRPFVRFVQAIEDVRTKGKHSEEGKKLRK